MNQLNPKWLAAASLLLVFRCATETNSQPPLVAGKLVIDGRDRTYLLASPANTPDTSLALVIFLHGGGGSAAQAERDYGWTAKALAEQFLVVYPEGVQSNGPLRLRTWNAGRCCDYATEKNIDDVKFIGKLIDHLATQYPIDPTRVYVTGMSNGAMLAYRLACEMPERLAAIAPVSGPLMVKEPCLPTRPVPVMHIHSELDSKVPYGGGKGIFGYNFSSVDSSLNVWSRINHCAPLATVVPYDKYAIHQGAHCTQPVRSYITKDGGHSWPGGLKPRAQADEPSQAFHATDVIWNFFQQHQTTR